MKQILNFMVCFGILGGLFSLVTFGQRATSFKLNEEDGGKLYITVRGKQKLVSEGVFEAWLLDNGKEVAFTSRGLGFDGEALSLYEVATEKSRIVLAKHSIAVIGITETKSSSGLRAILVRLTDVSEIDDGSEGSHFAVINPQRGQVLYIENTELTAIIDDIIRVSTFREKDWIKINKPRKPKDFKKNTAISTPTKVKPAKTETLDLKKVLKNKVIIDEGLEN